MSLIPKSQTMFARKVLALLVLLQHNTETHQQFAGCAESYYLLDGSCKSCPERCAACISDLNCTKCKGSHYGPVCKHTCQQDCEHFCHKEYGYCTYGCVDGQFSVKNSSQCAICPVKCTLCKSRTACAECLSGYYSITCENRCPTHCETCNKTTGACLKCSEGYFYKDGKCRRCPDGCVSCHDNTNCTRCQAGYLLLNNYQCIIECAIDSNMTALVQADHSNENEALRCCMKTHGQRAVHKTSKPCIQYDPCSSDIICPSKYGRNNTCGTIKTFQCNHTCHKLNESDCQCKPNCTIIEQNEPASLLCLTRQERILVIKPSMDSECFNVPETPPTLYTYRYTPVVVSVVLGLLCLAMGFYIIWTKKWCHHIWKSRRDTGNVEDAMGVEYGENEGTRTEPLLNKSSQEPLQIDETSHNLNQSETFDAGNDTRKTEGNNEVIRSTETLLKQSSKESSQIDESSQSLNQSEIVDADNVTQKTERINEETQSTETLLNQPPKDPSKIDETSHNSNQSETSAARNDTMKTVHDSCSPFNPFNLQSNPIFSPIINLLGEE